MVELIAGLLDILIALHVQVYLLPWFLHFGLTCSLFMLAIVQTIEINSGELRKHVAIVPSGGRPHAELLRGTVEQQLRIVERLLALRQLAERVRYLRPVVLASRCDLLHALLERAAIARRRALIVV